METNERIAGTRLARPFPGVMTVSLAKADICIEPHAMFNHVAEYITERTAKVETNFCNIVCYQQHTDVSERTRATLKSNYRRRVFDNRRTSFDKNTIPLAGVASWKEVVWYGLSSSRVCGRTGPRYDVIVWFSLTRHVILSVHALRLPPVISAIFLYFVLAVYPSRLRYRSFWRRWTTEYQSVHTTGPLVQTIA